MRASSVRRAARLCLRLVPRSCHLRRTMTGHATRRCRRGYTSRIRAGSTSEVPWHHRGSHSPDRQEARTRKCGGTTNPVTDLPDRNVAPAAQLLAGDVMRSRVRHGPESTTFVETSPQRSQRVSQFDPGRGDSSNSPDPPVNPPPVKARQIDSCARVFGPGPPRRVAGASVDRKSAARRRFDGDGWCSVRHRPQPSILISVFHVKPRPLAPSLCRDAIEAGPAESQ